MRTWRCVCDQTIFFENGRCLACGRDLGFCPACGDLVALLPGDKTLRCGNPRCGTPLAKCFNNATFAVCNGCVSPPVENALCRPCRFTETIPDLPVPGNLAKWARLEAGKRRLLYDLDLLRLPYGTWAEGSPHPLAFDFKADSPAPDGVGECAGDGDVVFTGHANGRITVNVREADDDERERTRARLGEAERTLIGHFRHEIGHYYWDVLVKGRREAEFKAVFGDHERPTYAEALATHYRQGSPDRWWDSFVSGYAAMHPWEDFAETWAAYLDLVSTTDTARNQGLCGADPTASDLDALVAGFVRLGVALNEVARNLGRRETVTAVFVPAVIEKLRFVHHVVRDRIAT